MAKEKQYMIEYNNVFDYVSGKNKETILENINKTFDSVFENATFTEEDIEKPKEMAIRVHELYLMKLIQREELTLSEANQYRKNASLKPLDYSSVTFLKDLMTDIKEPEPEPEQEKEENLVTETEPVTFDNSKGTIGINPAVEGSNAVVETTIVSNVEDTDLPYSLVQLSSIVVPPNLIRKPDDPELVEFIENVSQLNLIEPIVIRKLEDGSFELVVGSRRLQAAKHLGWQVIPAVVQSYSDLESLEVQGSENFQRKSFTTWELVDFIVACFEKGLKQKEVARICNMKESNFSDIAKVAKGAIPEDLFYDLREKQPNITRDALIEIAKLEEQEQREILNMGDGEVKAADIKKKKEPVGKKEKNIPVDSDITEEIEEDYDDDAVTGFDESILSITAQELLTELEKVQDNQLTEATKKRLTVVQEKIVEVLNG